MDVSFEQAMERLNQLPRMFTEPDGSFLWSGLFDDSAACLPDRLSPQSDRLSDHPEASLTLAPWRLDGMLYDREERVVRVEISGNCPRSRWLQLLQCLQPVGGLIAFLVEHQCFVRAEELALLLPGRESQSTKT